MYVGNCLAHIFFVCFIVILQLRLISVMFIIKNEAESKVPFEKEQPVEDNNKCVC